MYWICALSITRRGKMHKGKVIFLDMKLSPKNINLCLPNICIL